jgi:Fic family protein
MSLKVVNIWKPIQFSEKWQNCNTSKLDTIQPSWVRKRLSMKEETEEYKLFLNRLKRQHAIETGVIEKLYDLNEGITETFIKEGFVESYLQHGDTNIDPKQLMSYLNDNFEAIDFVFDLVKNNRPLTKGFIKELHQLITKHQDSAEGRDQFGNRLQIPLLKGSFKIRENNPTRADGTRFEYCPPVHVESEIEKLIEIYQDLEAKQVKPIIIASWLHHAFVSIHPFQDGNGRIARLITSLVLIKHGLFPLTVKRFEKKKYIDALESADNDTPQYLVDFFADTQKRSIEMALNIKMEVNLSKTSLEDVADIFSKKLAQLNEKETEIRKTRIDENRNTVFAYCLDKLNSIKVQVAERLKDNATLLITSESPNNSAQANRFTQQIVTYANKYDYFFNRTLPRGWFRFEIDIKNNGKYELIIILHHYGYDDATIAIGAILQYNESSKAMESDDNLITVLPFSLEPFTLSLDMEKQQVNIFLTEVSTFLENIVTLTLAQIASEI